MTPFKRDAACKGMQSLRSFRYNQTTYTFCRYAPQLTKHLPISALLGLLTAP
jgi:hypothetical protein